MKCHIILTIWTWLIQITVWISLFIVLLYTYYEIKLSHIKDIYPEEFDENQVPYYTSNWYENQLQSSFLPSLIVFIVSYILYIITEFYSPTLKFLKSKTDDIKLHKLLNDLFCGKPEVAFNCSCYHLVTRNYNYIDSKGNRQTGVELVTTITHTDYFTVPYYSVRDVSGPFVLNIEKDQLMQKDYIKLEIQLEITWADAISHSDYENYKSNFIQKNEKKDAFMNFFESRTLEGFKDCYLIKINDNSTNFISKFWYILSIFLTLAQYYKWYISSRCINQDFKIIKLLSTRHNLLQQEGYNEMQPKIDLINEQYDFDLSQTAFCEDKEITLPSLEEMKEAMNKYGQKVPNLVKVNENGRTLIRNLNKEKYKKTINFNLLNKKSEDAKEPKIELNQVDENSNK